MSPFRPWFCDYRQKRDGSIELRVAWENFPEQSVIYDHIFKRLEDVPASVRALLSKEVSRNGTQGRFEFPDGWKPVEFDKLRNLAAAAARPEKPIRKKKAGKKG